MVIRRRRPSLSSGIPAEVSPQVRLWLLRLLVPMGGHREFIRESGFGDDATAEVIGLNKWIDDPEGDFNPKAARAELRKLHREAEAKRDQRQMPGHLGDNVARLSKLVGLSEVDCRILEFATLIHSERMLDDAGDTLGQLSSAKVFYALSVLLDIPEKEVRAALSPQSLLSRSGLVSLDRSGISSLKGKLDLLSNNFADRIISSDADPINLLRDTVSPGVPPELEIDDYAHVSEMLSVLRPYLKQSIHDGRKGVNILLHGVPGTGKTQMVRVLAKELQRELFEVASEDSDGDPVNGERRLRAFGAAQTFFGKRRALILFDEVEDVFSDGNGFFGVKTTAQKHKAWINRMLEENPIPAFWLSNSIECMDPAFIRRFDMVFELPIPPKRQREDIIESACEGILDSIAIQRVAGSERLAPAVVARAASVVRSIKGELGEARAASAVEMLISNTLKAQGHRHILKHDPNRLPETYDPAFINADVDLASVAGGLVEARTGRLCLYGPPGTGKTAYGRWLAEQLNAPLVVKRASDLMSKWVGGNEKNIASAFRQAEQENAVLLIDEVDSFLQDRRGAQRGWETSMVNEMLTQMESFPGVFVAATNLMGNLDQAALRRFDLKVKFDFLTGEQAWQLFCRHCIGLGLPAPEDVLRTRLARLTKLTPGDFAAVARQQRFRPLCPATAMVAALEAECSLKEGPKAAIGFV